MLSHKHGSCEITFASMIGSAMGRVIRFDQLAAEQQINLPHWYSIASVCESCTEILYFYISFRVLCTFQIKLFFFFRLNLFAWIVGSVHVYNDSFLQPYKCRSL